MRIIRKARESIAGVREALAKAYNDGWMNGFEAGKEEGKKVSVAKYAQSAIPYGYAQRGSAPWVSKGDYYVGRIIDPLGNKFHIYNEDSPVILAGDPGTYFREIGMGYATIAFDLHTRLRIEKDMIGVQPGNVDGQWTTHYYIPYREEGYLQD